MRSARASSRARRRTASSKDKASSIFDQVDKFAGYGFNKSHAAAYALVCYQTAYLKANHPVEFFAATMTLDMGNADKLSGYRRELEKLGIELLPPDVTRSTAEFTVETTARRQEGDPLRARRDQGRRPRGDGAAGRGARGRTARSRTCSTSPSGSTSAC